MKLLREQPTDTNGLERIAEELMGRRKWKLYQDVSMQRSYLQPLNNNKVVNQVGAALPLVEDLERDHCRKLSDQEEDEPGVEAEAAEAEAVPVQLEDAATRESQKENGTGDNDKIEDEYSVKDWRPETKCHFCVDGKLDSEHNSHGVLSPRQSDSDTSDSDSESPPSLTPASLAAHHLLNNNHHRSNSLHHPLAANMTTIENMATLAAVAALSRGTATGGPSPHFPINYSNVHNYNLYLANVARQFQNQEQPDKVSGEQPLDLSKGSSNSPVEQKMGNNVRLPTLDTKHIFNSDFRAKPRMPNVAGRRTYTEEELQAALRDIQSGKLGTRRAAVIYGIPRSTLRNKVYKLALEKERETNLNCTGSLKLDEDEPMDDDKDLSGAEEEKLVEKALQAPLISYQDFLRNLDHQALIAKSKDGDDIPMDPEAKLMQSLLLASQNILGGQPPPDAILAYFKSLISEEQHKIQHNNGDSGKLSRPSPSNSVITKVDKAKSDSDMETDRDDAPPNVILKIPSFKPTSSKNGCDIYRNTVPTVLASPPVTSESNSPPIPPPAKINLINKDVKDVIAHNISQKFQSLQEQSRRPMLDMDFQSGGYTPPLSAGLSVIKTQPDINRQYQPPPKPQQQQQQGAPGAAGGGKGTRPKRGKYRNYDRDSLVEAVRAVQRGEMSVHRAGSYYGVPHSTLEYKVKERHLMRPRKRDPKPNPVDEKIASLKQNDIRNSEKLKAVAMKPPQKFSPTHPNGIKLPMFEQAGIPPGLPYNSPFPFWPPGFHPLGMPADFARNPASPFAANPSEFFNSQMMQKFGEDARAMQTAQTSPDGANNQPSLPKRTRQIAESLLDGPGSNNSFLDGIIRSSLDSGVPSQEEKSPPEDKNCAPENMSNKALLDQLCRNSRLTPLSKPLTNENANSSGDESYRKGASPLNFATGGMNNSHHPHDDKSKYSPNRYENNSVHTIELSNDSNDSSTDLNSRPPRADGSLAAAAADLPKTTPRIYLKPDLVNPDNLKPEMLVRFPDRNGIVDGPGSDTEND